MTVHTSPDQSVLLEEGDTLLAGDILPGFRLVSTDLLPTPRRSENHPDSCAAWLLEGLSLQRLKPFFSSQAGGLIVRLPDWTYPVVINTTTGQVR